MMAFEVRRSLRVEGFSGLRIAGFQLGCEVVGIIRYYIKIMGIAACGRGETKGVGERGSAGRLRHQRGRRQGVAGVGTRTASPAERGVR